MIFLVLFYFKDVCSSYIVKLFHYLLSVCIHPQRNHLPYSSSACMARFLCHCFTGFFSFLPQTTPSGLRPRPQASGHALRPILPDRLSPPSAVFTTGPWPGPPVHIWPSMWRHASTCTTVLPMYISTRVLRYTFYLCIQSAPATGPAIPTCITLLASMNSQTTTAWLPASGVHLAWLYPSNSLASDFWNVTPSVLSSSLHLPFHVRICKPLYLLSQTTIERNGVYMQQ